MGSTFVPRSVHAQDTEPRAQDDSSVRQAEARVAERRAGVDIICHRGASEFAHENTLEAYRASFELGADGNEIDIRATRDGVLVCFHDDMLDQLLEAYGDVSDYSWAELQQFPFRNPGRFGDQCRIPTLAEAFALHARYGGLMHLDIKREGLDKAIAELLTRMDMWAHVAYCNTDHGAAIVRDPRFRARQYKAGLYLDRGEVFPQPIAAALAQPGDGIIVDDPRGVAVALGRKFTRLSNEPVAPRAPVPPSRPAPRRTEAQLLAIIINTEHWDHPPESASATAEVRQRILARARAADQLLALRAKSSDTSAALAQLVRQRTLDKDWRYHGLDGAMALRALLHLNGPGAADVARGALWRDDPALAQVVDPRWNNPRAWTDFRVKMVIFPALERSPGMATEKLCRDYLALGDEEARQLGPPLFEQAARALLAVRPQTETALELMKHRLQVVRGRAILFCLAHADQPWAQAALAREAPHAHAYEVDY